MAQHSFSELFDEYLDEKASDKLRNRLASAQADLAKSPVADEIQASLDSGDTSKIKDLFTMLTRSSKSSAPEIWNALKQDRKNLLDAAANKKVKSTSIDSAIKKLNPQPKDATEINKSKKPEVDLSNFSLESDNIFDGMDDVSLDDLVNASDVPASDPAPAAAADPATAEENDAAEVASEFQTEEEIPSNSSDASSVEDTFRIIDQVEKEEPAEQKQEQKQEKELVDNKTETNSVAINPEEAKAAAQQQRDAEAAAQRQRDAEAAAQRQRDAEAAAQRQRDAEAAARRQRDAEAAARRQREAKAALASQEGNADPIKLHNDSTDGPSSDQNVNFRKQYSDVYDEIDKKAITSEQAEEAKRYADQVFATPDVEPRAYQALTGGSSAIRTKCIDGLLSTANSRLGDRSNANSSASNRINFNGGVSSQGHVSPHVRRSLVIPNGFGMKRNAAIWNTPIITDFGYPFINFSSEALLNIINSKEDVKVKNRNLKEMFKKASSNLGGVWKAIYAAPFELIRQIAHEIGTKCTPNYLKVDGNDLLTAEPSERVSVTPVNYYSVNPSYLGVASVPYEFLTSFYDVIDYSTSKNVYLKYSDGMTADEFVEEINDNDGIPPFYILVPKKASFSKCPIKSGSLFGSLMNVILGRQKYTMVKTVFQGKRGCIAMDEPTADKLYSNLQ